ncbi:MAG: HEAT repeat domain-containing protein [Candidatus Heimdallarchaeota archaeon]
MSKKEHVNQLIRDLKNGGLLTQKKAAKTLEKLGERAVAPLIQTLQDVNPGIRGYAAQILGRIGHKKAVEPLLLAIQDANPIVRMIAADVLKTIGDIRAIEPLRQLLKDNVRYVQIAAQEALAHLQVKKSED